MSDLDLWKKCSSGEQWSAFCDLVPRSSVREGWTELKTSFASISLGSGESSVLPTPLVLPYYFVESGAVWDKIVGRISKSRGGQWPLYFNHYTQLLDDRRWLLGYDP